MTSSRDLPQAGRRKAAPPRRVCLFIPSDAWGGAQRHTLALCEVLAGRGHDCVIVEVDEPWIGDHPEQIPQGVDVRLARLGATSNEPPFWDTYRVLRRTRADVGVFAKGFTRVAGVRTDLACRLAFGGRFLTIEHGSPPPRPPKASRRHFGGLVPGLGLWWYYEGLKVWSRSIFPGRVVTVSHAGAEHLIDDYSFPSRKMAPIPNGIDPERFVPDPGARARTRASWGVPADALVFGSVGRLSIPDKGTDVSIDLFSRLCADQPDLPLRYVLVGEGRDERELKDRAAAADFGSRILFTGETNRPWEVYPALDVLLLPSRTEGLAFALLESMSCGCCPVAMGVGGVRDVLTDPALGWKVAPGDHEGFLEGMKASLALGPEGRAAMGVRARSHVLAHFRATEQYGKLADLIERI